MSNNEKLTEIIIPSNVTQQRRILSFRMRNWIEAAISAAVVGFLIHLIPFTVKVQIIFTIFVAGSIAILNLLGIKGMSISETIINLVISSRTKYNYHLRSIRYVTNRKSETGTTAKAPVFNESIAEKGFRKAKEFIKAHIK